jgi:adenylate cyclase
MQATLPALSLAMKAHAGHVIASGLLRTYLGWDAGGRVHAGAVTRGSMERMRAAIWYADIRGFTTLSDSAPGPVVIALLNDAFEALTAALRERGGQVLKFVGDAMLATFSFEEADRAATCARAIDAVVEATRNVEALNCERAKSGAPLIAVDFALHVGEVLYGNVGAADRLDFTAIGPAINEVVRIEALCQPLGRPVLVSDDFAAIARELGRPLEPLGLHALRGVKAPKELFALETNEFQ